MTQGDGIEDGRMEFTALLSDLQRAASTITYHPAPHLNQRNLPDGLPDALEMTLNDLGQSGAGQSRSRSHNSTSQHTQPHTLALSLSCCALYIQVGSGACE